jgi:DNA-binding SARP family transcriptional activator
VALTGRSVVTSLEYGPALGGGFVASEPVFDTAQQLARTVRLDLIDGFRLEIDGAPVNPHASAERLLAFLALRGPVARVVAAGTLWGEVPEERALGSLRTAMWRCNRAVPGVVAVDRTRILLARFVHVDVTELVGGATLVLGDWDTGSMPVLRRGELLPGWYEDWVTFERERIRHLRLHALEAAAGQLVEHGNYAASLELALEAVRCEPLRESAHRAVIAVHLAEHNVAEALREYERFRTLLLEQLGIEPSDSLADLVFRAHGRRGCPAPVTRSTTGR